MARGNRSGSRRRDASPIANPSVDRRSDLFDRSWLSKIRENPSIRYVDLTRIEDRRRYHPANSSAWARQTRPAKNLNGSFARVVVVPAGHPLSRLQTYGGRYTLAELRKLHAQGKLHPHHSRGWQKLDEWSYGSADTYEYRNYPSHRLGFALPWQVVICVRRNRRRQVLHALRKTGRGKSRKNPRRNFYSEIRC